MGDLKEWWYAIRVFLYLTETDASELGFTHHGTLFGVPAWLHENGEDFVAAPKIPALIVWTLFADCCYEVASWLLPGDGFLKSPIYLTRPIREQR